MIGQDGGNGKRNVLPRSYVCLVTASAIIISIMVNPVVARIYYASPKGLGDGSSVESPFAVASFWDEVQPGDTLILFDGLYTKPRSMIKPPKNL